MGICDGVSATRRNVIGTCVDPATTPLNSLNLVRFDCLCDGNKKLLSCKVVGGGSGTFTGSAVIADMLGTQTCTLTGNVNGQTGVTITNAISGGGNPQIFRRCVARRRQKR